MLFPSCVLLLILFRDASGVPDPHNCAPQCKGPPKPLNASVPNVMIVGDSISSIELGYGSGTRDILADQGEAAVQHCGSYGRKVCGTSYGALACMPLWLGEGGWKVIHFNWGLHDICPEMYAVVTRQQYVDNMKAMYEYMKTKLAPNGIIIWSTTTPVPPSYKPRNNTDVVAINALMKELFDQYPEVVQSDLYGQIVTRCNQDKATKGYPQTSDCLKIQPNGVHFGFVNKSSLGRHFTAIEVSAAIAPYL